MSKRKPHNPLKRFQRQAEAALSGLCFGMKPGDESGFVIAYRLKDGAEVKVGPTVAKALGDCCFKYAFLLTASAVESNGKVKTKTDYQRMKSPYRHSDLIEHLNESHDLIIAQATTGGNKLQSAGWLACPVANQPDDVLERLMMSILTPEVI